MLFYCLCELMNQKYIRHQAINSAIERITGSIVWLVINSTVLVILVFDKREKESNKGTPNDPQYVVTPLIIKKSAKQVLASRFYSPLKTTKTTILQPQTGY